MLFHRIGLRVIVLHLRALAWNTDSAGQQVLHNAVAVFHESLESLRVSRQRSCIALLRTYTTRTKLDSSRQRLGTGLTVPLLSLAVAESRNCRSYVMEVFYIITRYRISCRNSTNSLYYRISSILYLRCYIYK